MKKYGPDFFNITNLLTEEELLIQQTAYDFVQAEFMPIINEHYENATFPMDIIPKLGELGFMGSSLPEESGGAGVSNVAYGLILHELERGDTGLRSFASVQGALVMYPIHAYGSDEQKSKWLTKLGSGEKIGCFGLTEPNFGSNPGGMATRCKRDGDDWILNGNKMWITNGPDAHTYIIYAKTDVDAKAKGITAFIVEHTFEGFSRNQKLDKLGMRGSNTCELIFENCLVPAENILGHEGQGVTVLMSGLDYERTVLSGGPVGIMQACLDVVLPYIHERVQFGNAIGEYQLMQGKIADMYADLNASRAYLYAVARACDQNQESRKDAAAVILFTAEKATQMALQAIQALGGNGYMNEYPAGRLLRDAKLYEIGAGTSEVRRMLIGRELFSESS